MHTSLQSIARTAARKPDHRFQDLSRLVTKELLLWSFERINKRAAPGVDKQDYQEYAANKETNIDDLIDRLKRGTYKARLVRRRYVPKGKGKKRPLGIPVTEDRMLQKAVAEILKAIYEQDFLTVSYGYRPNRGAKDAAAELEKKLQFGGYAYVVEVDIRAYFDSIDHDWMLKMLERRIDDRRFIRLITKWLKAGILEEDGRVINPISGTPQGGVVSAVLANIYLHYAMDMWIEKHVRKYLSGHVTMLRYADDFVILFEKKEDAERIYSILGARLKRFNLEVAEEKTRIVKSKKGSDDNDSFEFLGFEYYWGKSRKGKDIIKRRTSRNKLRGSIARFTEWIRKERHQKTGVLLKRLEAKYRGYWNYYGVIGNYESLNTFYEETLKIFYKWLNRRSQRRSYTDKAFRELLKRYSGIEPRIVEKWC
jgi:group II intron reverse transcriptase/maturase